MKSIEDKKLDKLIFAGLIGLTVLLPLAVRPGLVDRTLFKDIIFFLGIGLLLAGSAVFGLKKGFNVDKQTYLIIGLLGLVATSTWFSVHRETSIFGAHRLWQAAPTYMVLAAAYFMALQVKWDTARIKALTIAMVSVAVGLSLLALITFGYKFTQTGIIVPADKARALFPGPNAFAFFLTAIYPLALRLFLEARTAKAGKALLGLACIILLAAIFLTFDRTGWVVAVAASIAILLVGKKRIATAALILMLASVAFSARNPEGIQEDFKYFASTRLNSVFQSSSLGPRLSMWQAAKDLTLNRPLTGYGPDTFSLAVVGSETMGMAAFRNKPRTPHNFVLNISSTLGLPALILILYIFFRSIKAALASGDYLKQTLGLSMIATIILSQALIWHPYMMLPFWLFMAAVSPDKVFVRGPRTAAVKLGAIVIALLIIGWTGAVGAADRYYHLGTNALDRGQAQAYLNKAVAINPYADSYWRALFRKTRNEAFEERLSVVAQVKYYYPLSEEPLFMEATLRSENQETTEALRLLEDAIKIRPFYAEAHLLKAKVLSQLGRYDEAYKELAVATEIKTAKSKLVRQTTEKINQLSNP